MIFIESHYLCIYVRKVICFRIMGKNLNNRTLFGAKLRHFLVGCLSLVSHICLVRESCRAKS